MTQGHPPCPACHETTLAVAAALAAACRQVVAATRVKDLDERLLARAAAVEACREAVRRAEKELGL
jgi:hypothetical protein